MNCYSRVTGSDPAATVRGARLRVRRFGDHPIVGDQPKYLDAVSYPAVKSTLVEAAIQAGAPPEFLQRIEDLEQDRYEDADSLGRELSRSRAASNPSMVALTPEPCPTCGFLRVPGEDHSCLDEKAGFAEGVRSITDEFETLDERPGS